MLFLVLSTSIIVGIIGSAARSPSSSCCTNVINVMEIFSPAYPVNGTCFLTLNELIETSNKDECDKKEFVFHQGSYVINGSKHRRSVSLLFTYSEHLIVRGITNVIIKCVGSHKIKLTRSRNISIHNLQFQDCNNILIQSSHKHKTIEIANSNFSGSCLEFYFRNTSDYTALVKFKSTTIDRCNCTNETILYFGTPQTVRFVVKLHAVNVTDNYSPLIRSSFNLHVILEGHNSFHNNRGFVVHLANSKLSFTGAEVSFTDNSSPIHVEDSTITFEDSYVVFNENQGSLSDWQCGGITATERTQLQFKDNVTVKFTNNKGLYLSLIHI